MTILQRANSADVTLMYQQGQGLFGCIILGLIMIWRHMLSDVSSCNQVFRHHSSNDPYITASDPNASDAPSVVDLMIVLVQQQRYQTECTPFTVCGTKAFTPYFNRLTASLQKVWNPPPQHDGTIFDRFGIRLGELSQVLENPPSTRYWLMKGWQWGHPQRLSLGWCVVL